jgi:hypothetical protein
MKLDDIQRSYLQFPTFKSNNMENLQIYEVHVFIVLLIGVMK